MSSPPSTPPPSFATLTTGESPGSQSSAPSMVGTGSKRSSRRPDLIRSSVAAGNPLTVEAALTALRNGGNAVDAAVAATLMASVAEPMLTGLFGAGVAMVRMGGVVEFCDLFSDLPGRSAPERQRGATDELYINLGPSTQRFEVGPATFAVPGMLPGLSALHARYGRLSMARLVGPAVQAAEEGVPVSPAFETVLSVLWPIQRRDPQSARMFAPQGEPLKQGQTFRCPELGFSLLRYAQEGPRLFINGEYGKRLTDVLGDRSAYTPGDLVSWQPRFVEPLRYQYRDATVYLPPPPSVAGLLVMLCMRALEDHGAMPAPGSIDQVRFLAQALDRADIVRRQHLISRLFDRSFIDGFLAALVPADTSEGQAYGMPRQPGNTTHISVVDAEGNAVAITSSLGETCGLTLPGTGMLLNNFLGESDVYPTEAGITIGHRLMTMMCPTLIDLGDQVCALGSGGSSRIRSAILHGVVNLVDHAMTPAEAAAAPRLHMEGGTLYIEAADRLPGTVRAAGLSWPQLRRFEEPSMFFGGLNIAAGGEQGYTAGADPRRSGAIGIL